MEARGDEQSKAQQRHSAPSRPLPPVPPILPASVLPALPPASPPTPPRRRGSSVSAPATSAASQQIAHPRKSSSVSEHLLQRGKAARGRLSLEEGSNKTETTLPPLSLGIGSTSKLDSEEHTSDVHEAAGKAEALLTGHDFLDSGSEDSPPENGGYQQGGTAINSGSGLGSSHPSSLRRGPTFSAKYTADPPPGQWGAKELPAMAIVRSRQAESLSNMPLEPDEYTDSGMPWIVEQMGLGERPLSSLFTDDVDEGRDEKHERKRKRKMAFSVLKRRVIEARIGIPNDPPRPDIESFRREDETVDHTAYWCSRIKHYADTELRHKLDYRHSTSDPCKIDRFILSLQRLVEVSAPYQRFALWLYNLARWDNPKVTAWWCLAYFIALYMDMLVFLAWMTPAFVIAYHRLRPSHAYVWLGFERPGTSIIPSKILEDASAGTIGKGLAANQLWDIWRGTLGAHMTICLADVADWMERAKNCATWRRPWASRSVMVVIAAIATFLYLIPAYTFQKLLGLLFGVQFFFLAPLQLRHQKYRRILWIPDWLLWHSPTDVELAVEHLYSQHPGQRDPAGLLGGHGGRPAATQSASFLHTIASDFIHAYNPFSKRQHPPITILQTASSSCLDRIGDEAMDSSGFYETLAAGGRLGKKLLDEIVNDDEEEEYSGIGADKDMKFPSMMHASEEIQRLKDRGWSQQTVGYDNSVENLGNFGSENIVTHPGKLHRAEKFSGSDLLSEVLHRHKPEGGALADSAAAGSSDEGHHDAISTNSQTGTRSFMSRAKAITSKLRRKSATHEPDSTPPSADQMSISSKRSSVSTVWDNLRGKHHRHHHHHQLDSEGPDIDYNDNGTIRHRRNRRSSVSSDMSRASMDSVQSASAFAHMIERFDTNDVLEPHNQGKAHGDDGASIAKDSTHTCLSYAFKCIHRGRYGTLFVTPDHFVFQKSRLMGRLRASISSYSLRSVVAIRKCTGGLGRSHGIQLLLEDGKSHSFYGLGKRDDMFVFLLLRCGGSHTY
ncbi:hypothetical protein GGI12_000863 [Dipsacomyces acuminosporus]|nr:hypothetical protein GGI12_000863 [Dipsacomyces acuminosporus]